MTAENYDTLATHFDKIIAVDWPGMGCSSRVATRFSLPTIADTTRAVLCSRDHDREKEIAQAVTDELIDALEKLRIDEDIPHFTLAGHSLGGYLAGKYAVKYPKAVDNLVLISPVGIPLAPLMEERQTPSEMDWRVRAIDQLWKWNFTPQGIVRVMGSRGPKIVSDMINRRFGRRWDGVELDLISDYFYHITAAPGSGEYTLSALLEPVFLKPAPAETATDVVVEVSAALSGGSTAVNTTSDGTVVGPKEAKKAKRVTSGGSGVFAKLPLEDELCALRVPILLVYGDNDWLYYPTAAQSVQKWKDHGVPAAALGIISNAGHHLYLDNSKDFNRTLIKWVENSEKVTHKND